MAAASAMPSSSTGSSRISNVIAAGLAVLGTFKLWQLAGVLPPAHGRLWLLLMMLFAGLFSVQPPCAFELPSVRRQLQIVSGLLLAAFCTLASASGVFLVHDVLPSIRLLLTLFASAAVTIPLCQEIAARAKAALAPRRFYLIYGANELGIALAERLAREAPDCRILGFLDDRLDRRINEALPHPLLGGLDAMPVAPPNGQGAIDGVIIALPEAGAEQIAILRSRLRSRTPNVFLASTWSIAHNNLMTEKQLGAVRCLLLGADDFNRTEQSVKRLLDIVVASVALLIFAPLLLVCALIIKLESDGPVVYIQKRYTTHGRLFDCYKLRSMYTAPASASPAGSTGIELTKRNDSRVTRFGAFLRRSSLDELPQFINVLQGHMSVVGPRPHPPGVKAGERLYEQVVSDFGERYKVKPGITGWAQVSGLRGNTFTESMLVQRFQYDVEYISNWSLSLEILIILKTLFGGFGGKNAF